jgi:hypothetical protein
MKIAVVTREFWNQTFVAVGITLGIILSMWGAIDPLVCEAVLLNDSLSFLQYTDNLQPYWGKHDGFSQVAAQAFKEHLCHYNHFAAQPDRDLSNTLTRLTKKIRFTVSPKAVIKPFMIVQEIHTMLQIYQSRQLRKRVQVDENYQAKTMLVPTQHTTQLLDRLKQSLARTFSVSPYQHRIYGLHFQVTW